MTSWRELEFRPAVLRAGADATGAPFDSVDARTRLFVDAGYWGTHDDWRSGKVSDKVKSDFVVITGRQVFRCRWLDKPKSGVQVPKHVKELFTSDRGGAVEELRGWSEITDPNHMIVVIPDLHLSLFKEQASDNFVYAPPGGVRTSLEGELAALLFKCKAAGAEVWQIGDAYEMWEAQALLLRDLRTFRAWRDADGSNGYFPSSGDYAKALYAMVEAAGGSSDLGVIAADAPSQQHRRWTAERKTVRSGREYEVIEKIVWESPDQRYRRENLVRAAAEQGMVIPRDPRGNLFESMLGGEGQINGSSVPWSSDTLGSSGVPVFDQDGLRKAIEKCYKKIFGDGRPWKWIRGNHDNMLETRVRVFGAEETIPAAGEVPPSQTTHTHKGKTTIVAEHGHAYDFYNNDADFDEPGGGWEKTVDYVLAKGMSAITGGELGSLGGAVDRAVGDLVYNMRPSQKLRACKIFQEHPDAKVVVMGHWHAAELEDFDTAARQAVNEGID